MKESPKVSLTIAFKSIFTAVPALAIVMSSLYYWVFFSNFDGLEPNILSVGDYFDKAVEFIPCAILVLFGLAFALLLYPPKFQEETDGEYLNRIGGSKKAWSVHDKFLSLFIYVGVPVVLLRALFFVSWYEFIQMYSILLMFPIIALYKNVEKHFSANLQKVLYTRVGLLILIGLMISTVYIVRNATMEASEIKSSNVPETQLIDIINAGYLSKKADQLILKDKDQREITRLTIEEPSNESIACIVGLKFSCPKSKNMKKASTDKTK